jgi:hypothetical protein
VPPAAGDLAVPLGAPCGGCAAATAAGAVGVADGLAVRDTGPVPTAAGGGAGLTVAVVVEGACVPGADAAAPVRPAGVGAVAPPVGGVAAGTAWCVVEGASPLPPPEAGLADVDDPVAPAVGVVGCGCDCGWLSRAGSSVVTTVMVTGAPPPAMAVGRGEGAG